VTCEYVGRSWTSRRRYVEAVSASRHLAIWLERMNLEWPSLSRTKDASLSQARTSRKSRFKSAPRRPRSPKCERPCGLSRPRRRVDQYGSCCSRRPCTPNSYFLSDRVGGDESDTVVVEVNDRLMTSLEFATHLAPNDSGADSPGDDNTTRHVPCSECERQPASHA